LLIDLDGVVRAFDPAWMTTVEMRHNLPAGTLWETAFEESRVQQVVTGQITHADWMAEVGEVIGAPAAVEEWETDRGAVDHEVIDLVRKVRASGFPVALGTNATDRLDQDLELLGLTGEFDAIVNASAVGFAKPHPRFFEAACEALGVPASEVLFLDDSVRYVAGARSSGLIGLRYGGHDDLKYVRIAFGV
jgi:putative hydrolase of the HAD superfamily